MGQASLPVEPTAHTIPATAAAAMSGSSGMASMACAPALLGSWKNNVGNRSAGVAIQFAIGRSGRQSPIGSSRITVEARSG
jgi:hypothetical protein